MKKYIFGLALMAGFVLTSCDTDNEGAIYNPSWQNISFEMAKPAQLLTQESSLTVPVRLIRSNTTEAYTAHYTMSSEAEGIFTDGNGGQVSFDKGQSEAVVTLTANNMEKGNLYQAVLQLSDADVALADTTTKSAVKVTTISVMCDYNWTALGKGFYSSPEWWEDEYNVDILQAEGASPKLYKILGLFQKGYDIKFTINDNNEVYVPQQASWVHNSYGTVYLWGYANEDSSSFAGMYDPNTKQASLTMVHFVDAGSFGAYTDTLTMP